MSDAPASGDFVRYTLAISDMEDVAASARLILDHDPDPFDIFGPPSAPPGSLPWRPASPHIDVRLAAALRKPGNDLYQVLRHNHRLRLIVETGLMVTYARPFTEGRGLGFPISEKRFVPAEKRDFHQRMMDLRNKAQAHIDASAPEGFRRRVTRSEGPGSSGVSWSGPRFLNADELLALAELADEVAERLKSARST